jgi:hypothetical protein
MAATGRGFQDTGSTAKAFEGEEVDWYVCNVASYHVKQSMDPSAVLIENEDTKRLLLLDDETIVRAAAVAVGLAELELLLAHYSAAEEWVEAAKVAWAVSMVSTGVHRVKHGKAAPGLLTKAESATTPVQQLELYMRGTLEFMMPTGPEKKQNAARMTELMAQNKSLRIDPLSLFMSSVLTRMVVLIGTHPKMWDAGKIATVDTVRKALGLFLSDGMLLLEKAVEESVGARRECVKLGYEMSYCIIFVMPTRSTEEAAELHQQLLDEKWGRDGSILVAACMKYSFARHYEIAQGVGTRQDSYLYFPLAQGVAEHCGDVQQMVQLFEKQFADQGDLVKSGVAGMEGPQYCYYVAPTCVALELKALHSFGKGLVALLGSWCTDPSECEGCFESNNWAVLRARYGKGTSSKDGLHHMFLNPALISSMQATLSLSLASTGTSNFDLSWLDGLPAADDSKLHCNAISAHTFVNQRVVIAEVFEWQGRYKEAVRCVHFHAHSRT